MPVFISHKNADSFPAIKISRYLSSRGIDNYVDVLESPSQSIVDITDKITARIGESTHLIAVMSNSTKDSWWVPFEIGEATFGLRRITSYDLGCTYGLPEYLMKWPVMTEQRHLVTFADAYKADNATVSRLDQAIDNSTFRSAYGPANFHGKVKSLIR